MRGVDSDVEGVLSPKRSECRLEVGISKLQDAQDLNPMYKTFDEALYAGGGAWRADLRTLRAGRICVAWLI